TLSSRHCDSGLGRAETSRHGVAVTPSPRHQPAALHLCRESGANSQFHSPKVFLCFQLRASSPESAPHYQRQSRPGESALPLLMAAPSLLLSPCVSCMRAYVPDDGGLPTAACAPVPSAHNSLAPSLANTLPLLC